MAAAAQAQKAPFFVSVSVVCLARCPRASAEAFARGARGVSLGKEPGAVRKSTAASARIAFSGSETSPGLEQIIVCAAHHAARVHEHHSQDPVSPTKKAIAARRRGPITHSHQSRWPRRSPPAARPRRSPRPASSSVRATGRPPSRPPSPRPRRRTCRRRRPCPR